MNKATINVEEILKKNSSEYTLLLYKVIHDYDYDRQEDEDVDDNIGEDMKHVINSFQWLRMSGNILSGNEYLVILL